MCSHEEKPATSPPASTSRPRRGERATRTCHQVCFGGADLRRILAARRATVFETPASSTIPCFPRVSPLSFESDTWPVGGKQPPVDGKKWVSNAKKTDFRQVPARSPVVTTFAGRVVGLSGSEKEATCTNPDGSLSDGDHEAVGSDHTPKYSNKQYGVSGISVDCCRE